MELWKAVVSAAVQEQGFLAPLSESRFHPTRLWRFDLCWPSQMVALEKEGQARKGGKSRHTTFTGYAGDCEKYSRAAIMGWCVIRATTKQLESGEAVKWVIEALEARKAK